jgi:Na+/H+-dicarboxylate symporter
VGAASVGDPKKLGRIGVKTLVLYLLTTAVAVAIGLALGNLMQPGVGMNIAGAAGEVKPSKPLLDVLLAIFPTNPVDSMVRADMLQIIIFALFFGVAAIFAGEKGKRIVGALDSVAEVMYSMTHMIMGLAPYGVFSLIAVTASKYGISILAPFAKVIAAVYIGCALHSFIVYSGMVAVFCKRSPLWYFKGVQEASITAFVTRSSSATLPVTIANVQQNLGVSESVSSFVLPLGATINMDGTALYQGVCVLFVAQAFGVELGLGAQLGIILTATLASIGTAGVPGAGLIMLTLVLTSAGLPVEGIGLVAGIDAILDAARTCVNVTGDTAVCAVVAATEGEKLSS